MSVALIDNNSLSQIAHSASELGLGTAAELGAIIAQQNMNTFNERYSESNKAEFTLMNKDSSFTRAEMFEECEFWQSNSYSCSPITEKAFTIIRAVMRNAVYPIQSNEQFSEIIGQPVYSDTNHYARFGFVASHTSPHSMDLLYYDRCSKEWKLSSVRYDSYKSCNDTPCLFKLSVEQVEGLRNEIKNRLNQQRLQYEMEVQKRKEEQADFNERFKAIMPTGSKAVLIAELLEDDCGHNDDYYGSKTTKRVLLGFSKHTRRLFPEMRKASLNYEPTHFLFETPKSSEHRECYSMGRGVYLTEGSTYSGWSIRKEIIYSEHSISPAEILDVDYSALPSKPPKKEKKKIEKASKDKKPLPASVNTDKEQPQKKTATVVLPRGVISLVRGGQVSFKSTSPLNAQEKSTLVRAGFSFDASSEEWNSPHTAIAMNAVRALCVDVRCGVH